MDAVDDDYVVKLPSGDARVMNLDELDAAFDAGKIHAASPVLAPGTTTWTTLGVLAGLDDVASPVPMSPSSIAPMVMSDLAGDDDDAASLVPKRRGVKVVAIAFAAIAIFFVALGIKSAVSQSIATSAGEAALAAMPPAPPPPAAMPLPLPRASAAVEPAAPKPAPAAAPVAATASSKPSAKATDKDAKKGKLPGAPAAVKKKK